MSTRELPLLLHAGKAARGLDDAPDPQTLEALIRGEHTGCPSVLWVESLADLDAPAAVLVTHIAVPASETDSVTELHQEALGRFGPERVLRADGPEEARQAVHATTTAARQGASGSGLGRALRSTLRRLRRLTGGGAGE
ncbi:hypothetical protein [Nesterenkonia xinjiangensis]|uniref:Uncharacterized protein n=1 Tax=Nesterenkonia xinjiangensis TaxID=225327 RepID=A0A7Z0GJN7_9MICC|nr:hypothetical protein [Nesterenkonia xinjiangensis]NYJ76988.1 hypothetical protein [Nesterenkonia xinjiangensis]